MLARLQDKEPEPYELVVVHKRYQPPTYSRDVGEQEGGWRARGRRRGEKDSARANTSRISTSVYRVFLSNFFLLFFFF